MDAATEFDKVSQHCSSYDPAVPILPRNVGAFPRVPQASHLTTANKRRRGFSIVELMVVVIILGVLVAIAIPSVTTSTRNFRIGGDTRAIAAQLDLARMRAAADFTHARVYINLNGNTLHLEIWNKAGDSTHTTGCWQTDGDSNACTQASSPVTSLAEGDTFGFGSISAGPTASTSTTAQAPACTSGVAGASAGSSIANTACIEFNSRGYPVGSTNTIVASDALYITNNSTLYSAVAVSISGQPTAYAYTGSKWTLF
jgi:prepilin-type N-terminal cleavage/methylation domain-containing protein